MPPTDPERFIRVPRPREFPDPDDWRRWGPPPFPIAVVDPGEQSITNRRPGPAARHPGAGEGDGGGAPAPPAPTAFVGDRLLVRNDDNGGQARLRPLDAMLANLNWKLGPRCSTRTRTRAAAW